MIPGWDDLTESLSLARAEIAAAAPDAVTATEGEAYLMRVLTSSLAECFIGHLLSDGGMTQVLPTRGGSNPHYLMRTTGIDPARDYRVRGRLNNSERTGIGVYSLRPDGAALLAGYATFDAGNSAPDGSFTLDLGPKAQGPDSITLSPDARLLIVRTLHRDFGETPAQLALSGGPPVTDMTLASGTSDGALRQAGQMTLRTVRQFLAWSRVTSAKPNCLTPPPPELGGTVLGTPETDYFLGYYALEEGEWLEIPMPAGLQGYWSVQACNHWLEMLPGADVHDLSATPDPDGGFRVHIGPSVPADLPNRIDTLGRSRGVLLWRPAAGQNPAVPQAIVRRK